jgi:hypothetical protein
VKTLLPVADHAKIDDRQEWGKLVHGSLTSRVGAFATQNGQFGLTRRYATSKC